MQHCSTSLGNKVDDEPLHLVPQDFDSADTSATDLPSSGCPWRRASLCRHGAWAITRSLSKLVVHNIFFIGEFSALSFLCFDIVKRFFDDEHWASFKSQCTLFKFFTCAAACLKTMSTHKDWCSRTLWNLLVKVNCFETIEVI